MKKFLCIFVTCCILFAGLSLPLFAIDGENEEISSEPENVLGDALTYVCNYDAEKKRVMLSGSLNNEIFSDHGGWSICVYAVPTGASEYDIIEDPDSKPLAETLISKKFEFSLKADEIRYRYSRYAIFLRSPDGEMVLASKAQYPEVKYSEKVAEGMRNYKGISADFSSLVTDVDAGTLILPVYLEELFSQTSSSMFFLADGKQYFFNDAVIDKLDVAINSTAVFGTKIYLRLICTDNDSNSGSSYEYSVPRLDDGNMLVRLHSAISFLSERYAQSTKCKISGFVLGNAWNDAREILTAGELERYVMLCGEYAVIVANASRTIDPELEVVIPFDGEEFVSMGADSKTVSQNLLESLFEYLDDGLDNGLNCSLLISARNTPLGIKEITPQTVIDIQAQGKTGLFCAGEQKAFSEYLDMLSHRYDSCPESYIFEWLPDSDLKDTAFAAAYAYSFYSLLIDETVNTFVVGSSSDTADIYQIKHLIKFIDAYEGTDVVKYLASYFGKSSWSEIFGLSSEVNTSVKHYFTVDPRLNTNETFLGEFKYFDPADISLLQNWHGGDQCINIESNVSESGVKALKADMLLSRAENYAEMIYLFEYSENMIHTKDLKLKFELSGADEDALYELKLVLGNSKNKIESSCIVNSNSVNEMFVDVSKCVTANTIDFIKLSVRSLDGKSDACSLSVYEISGLSNEFTSEELKNIVHAEREKIRDEREDEDNSSAFSQVLLGIGIVLVTGAVGIVIFLGFKREDREAEDKDDIADD